MISHAFTAELTIFFLVHYILIAFGVIGWTVVVRRLIDDGEGFAILSAVFLCFALVIQGFHSMSIINHQIYQGGIDASTDQK